MFTALNKLKENLGRTKSGQEIASFQTTLREFLTKAGLQDIDFNKVLSSEESNKFKAAVKIMIEEYTEMQEPPEEIIVFLNYVAQRIDNNTELDLSVSDFIAELKLWHFLPLDYVEG